MIGNRSEITDKSIQMIFNDQQYIKREQFIEEELHTLLKRINRAAPSLDELSTDVWKTRNFYDIVL